MGPTSSPPEAIRRLQWLTTPVPSGPVNASSPSPEFGAVYCEVEAQTDIKLTMLATAVNSNLGSIGLLHSGGRQYATLYAPGIAAAPMLLKSGDEVDIKWDPPPPPPPPDNDFRGLRPLQFPGVRAMVELEKADLDAGPLAFMLLLDHEDGGAAHWKGWPRSLAYNLSGYVHLSSQGIWRLLAVVHGHVVTDGVMNFGGFLGNVSSTIEPLGSNNLNLGNQSTIRFGPARFQSQHDGFWNQFKAALFSGAGEILETKDSIHISLTARGGDQVPVVVIKNDTLPLLLAKYPVPDGDNSIAAEKQWKQKPFGPRHQRLEEWGQFYDQQRVFSCVTPDLAAVMADPLQYTPPTGNTINWNEYCDPMLAEHFWWSPPKSEPLDAQIEWFYNEITVEKSAPFTYFMSNGFYGGYFGIQEHANGVKYALFSVWDAGSKVEIVDWGEGVKVGRFGAEGTGANSHVRFNWELNQPIRFLVNVKVEPSTKPGGPKTSVYSGYIHDPKQGIWRLLSRLRVQPCGHSFHSDGHLLGMNSFIEVFQALPKKPHCEAYHTERRARYGPPWYKKKGESFKQFHAAILTATCPETGCPKQGLNSFSYDSESFVMQVGGNVTNEGLPIMQQQPIKQSMPLPSVLAEGALPYDDNSPAGGWPAGSQRPLRQFGEDAGFKNWGSGGNDLSCPWYVLECGGGYDPRHHAK